MEKQTLNKTFALISLGCDKNRVDGERLLGEIAAHGCPITTDLFKAQVLIVNTCAFLTAAREEAILSVLEGSRLKEEGKLEKLVVTGCLPQGYEEEVFPALTEADVFLGTADAKELFPALERAYAGERVSAVGSATRLPAENGELLPRVLSTPDHYKFLKISEGCSNHCTYCLIPSIRGKYLSYPMEALIEEAKGLGRTEELILVAQDITRYGEDTGENKLVPLLKKLSELDNICHIRLLYCYPEKIGEELIAEIRDNPKILKYLDIPLQHAEDRVLKLMGRRGTRAEYLALFARLRAQIPGIALRTTFISGFPTETEEEHKSLLAFLREAKFMNCGCFAYSREPNTPAYKLKGQVHHATKQRRAKELYAVQREISRANLEAFVGKTLHVLCDGIDMERSCFVGRAYFQAPDIDGVVYFTANEAKEGQIYPVSIDRAEEYDLFGHAE